jgi:hypothetical protein
MCKYSPTIAKCSAVLAKSPVVARTGIIYIAGRRGAADIFL